MKLVRSIVFAGLGVGSAAALVLTAQGCGSTASTPTEDAGGSGTGTGPGHSSGTGSSTGTGTGSGTGKTSGTGSGTGKPVNDHTDAGRPPGSGGGATTSTTKHNFAIHNLYLGDTNADAPTFTASTTAWENFGYNIDGLITTAQSTDVCSPYTKGNTVQQIDGTNGIDNAFGSQITTQLQTFGLSSSKVSGDIAAGNFTLEFDTVGLDGTATQTATGLSGQLFAGSTYAGTPALNAAATGFAITDDWPVNGSLLVNPTDIDAGSTVVFPGAYVSAGTWVSGSQSGSIALTLSLAGVSLTLNIHAGVITMPVTSDSTMQLHAKEGFVSGVIDTAELLSAIDPILAKLGYCSAESVAVGIISNAQDIIISGQTVSNKANTPCNGISVGLAFDADEIAQPDTIAPSSDAGAPASCGGDAG
jgi:hypothetical protein